MARTITTYIARIFGKEICRRDEKYGITTSYLFLGRLYFWKYEDINDLYKNFKIKF